LEIKLQNHENENINEKVLKNKYDTDLSQIEKEYKNSIVEIEQNLKVQHKLAIDQMTININNKLKENASLIEQKNSEVSS